MVKHPIVKFILAHIAASYSIILVLVARNLHRGQWNTAALYDLIGLPILVPRFMLGSVMFFDRVARPQLTVTAAIWILYPTVFLLMWRFIQQKPSSQPAV